MAASAAKTKPRTAMNQERFLKLAEVQAMLGVSRSTIWRWYAERNLRVVRVGGMTRIRASDLQVFLERHESKAFVPLMDHVLLSRHRGRPFWPRKMAGDKGYSYPEVRGWLERHKIQAVIPTRKDQTQDPNFNKTIYRRRNLIERVVGWFKECRALGTRYEKLAVSYLALWVVAMIDKLLNRRLPDSA